MCSASPPPVDFFLGLNLKGVHTRTLLPTSFTLPPLRLKTLSASMRTYIQLRESKINASPCPPSPWLGHVSANEGQRSARHVGNSPPTAPQKSLPRDTEDKGQGGRGGTSVFSLGLLMTGLFTLGFRLQRSCPVLWTAQLLRERRASQPPMQHQQPCVQRKHQGVNPPKWRHTPLTPRMYFV